MSRMEFDTGKGQPFLGSRIPRFFCHNWKGQNHCNKYPYLSIHPSIYLFFRVVPMAHGGSQARGRIGAAATGLRQSHSNAVSEPRLQPTPQLTATPDR